ncbi:MAG: hypothetical protein AAF368_02040 [Planctomycetota bacterium]
MRSLLRSSALLLALAGATTSCVSHTHATEFNGVDGIRGEAVEYQSTTSIALHGLFVFPLWGNGKMPKVVDEFTAEAGERGGSRVRIANTSSLTYWFVFPPLSFFIHPVVTTVEGDVEGASGDEAE